MKKILLLSAILLMKIYGDAQVSNENDLPVFIQTLNAARIENKVQLKWQVTCSIEFANFEIQRSSDGLAFTTINTFKADKVRCRQPFYYDDQSMTGRTYYRVKAANIDGEFYSSKIISITAGKGGYAINSLSPTIVNSTTVLNISSPTNEKAVIKITSYQGINVWQQTTQLKSGTNEIRLQLGKLSKGSYVLSSSNSAGETRTIAFVKM
jgi:hypothetical protein